MRNAALDLSFVQDGSKGLATMIKESYGKLSSSAALVWSASHFPRLSGCGYFHSAFRTFGHAISPSPYYIQPIMRAYQL